MSDLCIGGLADIFVPAGLPLVEKTDSQPTTSVLVHGLAGSGKTTLALGIGWAIARELDGALLYVTTEVSPADLAAKLRLLAVDARPADASSEQSAKLMFRSLSAEPDEEVGALLDAVWATIERARSSVTLRVVVVDAALFFGRPVDAGARRDLLDFTYACEGAGVSVVLVEETLDGAPTPTSFVVDVVLSPSLRARNDGPLERWLVCTKARYARVLPGPHRFLDAPTPWISVDLLDRALGAPSTMEIEHSARIAQPLLLGNDTVAYVRGGVVSSASTFEGLASALDVAALSVRFGPRTRVGDDGPLVPESVGFSTIATRIVEEANRLKCRAIVLGHLDYFGRQPMHARDVRRALEALAIQGFLVGYGEASGAPDEMMTAAMNTSAEVVERDAWRALSLCSGATWLLSPPTGPFDSPWSEIDALALTTADLGESIPKAAQRIREWIEFFGGLQWTDARHVLSRFLRWRLGLRHDKLQPPSDLTDLERFDWVSFVVPHLSLHEATTMLTQWWNKWRDLDDFTRTASTEVARYLLHAWLPGAPPPTEAPNFEEWTGPLGRWRLRGLIRSHGLDAVRDWEPARPEAPAAFVERVRWEAVAEAGGDHTETAYRGLSRLYGEGLDRGLVGAEMAYNLAVLALRLRLRKRARDHLADAIRLNPYLAPIPSFATRLGVVFRAPGTL